MKLHIANKRQHTLSVYDMILAKYGLNRIPGAFNGQPGIVSVEVPDKDIDKCCSLLKKKAPYLVFSKGEPPKFSSITGNTTDTAPMMAPPPDAPVPPPGNIGNSPIITKINERSTVSDKSSEKEDTPKKKK